MSNLQSLFQIDHYLDLFIRKRWFLIVPLFIALPIGMYKAVTLPRIYEAETLILVQPQKVPQNFVKSVVSSGIESRISTIQQQIMSRTNLEKIIQDYKLFSKPNQRDMFLEDKIASLRKRIGVRITGRRGADAFGITFKGAEPKKITDVANALASYVINENLKVRESQAVGTSVFLEDELNTMRKSLSQIEQELKNYRTRHMGALPEQLNSNLAILNRLQEQLDIKKQALRESKAAAINLEQQLVQARDLQASDGGGDFAGPDLFSLEGSGDDVFGASEAQASLTKLEEQKKVLLLKYTERHPDVARITKMIESAKEQIELEKAQAESEAETSEDLEALNDVPSQPEFDFNAMQKAQLNELKQDIFKQKKEVAEIGGQIILYRKRVEETPRREQELMAIERDHENIQSAYNSLLARKLEASMSMNMEKKQKGEQFQIIDYARVPERPISPNLKMIFGATIVGSVGLGALLIVLLDFLDTAIRRPRDVEVGFGVHVIAAIPKIKNNRDLFRQRLRGLATLGMLLICGIMTVAFAFLAFSRDEEILMRIRNLIA